MTDSVGIGDVPVSELSHYGIKGMKWGVRRTPEQLGHKPKKPRKPTAKEITDARERHNERAAAIERNVNRANIVGTKAAKQKAAKEIRRLAKEAKDSGDISTMARMTRGEMAVSALSGGPFGLLTLYAAKKNYEVQEHNINMLMDAYGQITIDDFASD